MLWRVFEFEWVMKDPTTHQRSPKYHLEVLVQLQWAMKWLAPLLDAMPTVPMKVTIAIVEVHEPTAIVKEETQPIVVIPKVTTPILVVMEVTGLGYDYNLAYKNTFNNNESKGNTPKNLESHIFLGVFLSLVTSAL